MSFHVPIAVDLAIILAAALFCVCVFVVRAATFSRYADLVALGMTVCATVVAVRPWGVLIRQHAAPPWLTVVAAWFLVSVGCLYWYELRPVIRDRKSRIL